MRFRFWATLPGDALEIKKQIGLVPDETLLFDNLTGAEFIEFVGRMYGLAGQVARERAKELLDMFELGATGRKLIAEYSKGMRKRVAMAAALIHRPQLFLMDEPFEGVDAVGARLMKDILLDQVRQGATIFLTSTCSKSWNGCAIEWRSSMRGVCSRKTLSKTCAVVRRPWKTPSFD